MGLDRPFLRRLMNLMIGGQSRMFPVSPFYAIGVHWYDFDVGLVGDMISLSCSVFPVVSCTSLSFL